MTDAGFAKQLERAREAGKATLASERKAVDVQYLESSDELRLELEDGAELLVPVSQLEGLSEAGPEALRSVELTPDGLGLHWDALDVHYTVPGLVKGLYGTRAWMQAIGRKGGRAASTEKRRAARENGARGGRPQSRKVEASGRPGKFVLKQDSGGRYLAELRASNGRVLIETPPCARTSDVRGYVAELKKLARREALHIKRVERSSGHVLELRPAGTEKDLLAASRPYRSKTAASRAKGGLCSAIVRASQDADLLVGGLASTSRKRVVSTDDLAMQVAEELGRDPTDVKRVLDAMAGTITSHLEAEHEVRFFDLGTFEIRKRKARGGVKPGARQGLRIPESALASFVPSGESEGRKSVQRKKRK